MRAMRCGVCSAFFTHQLLDAQKVCRNQCRFVKMASFEAAIAVSACLAVLASILLLVEVPKVRQLGAGSLLVATDQIRTGIFQRSVILLVEYSHWGALGFIINHPLNDSAKRDAFWRQLQKSDAAQSVGLERSSPSQRPLARGSATSLFEGIGGPVKYRGSLTHLMSNASGTSEEQQVLKGVWWRLIAQSNEEEASRESTSCLALHADNVMCLHGYAGWAPRQLEMEIARGSWYIVPNTTQDVVFSEPLTLWDRLTTDLQEKALDGMAVSPQAEFVSLWRKLAEHLFESDEYSG